MEYANGSQSSPQTHVQDNVAPTLSSFTDSIISKVDAQLPHTRQAAVAPSSSENRRFAEVYWDGEAWQIILWESHEAEMSAGEQEFSYLDAQARRYMQAWSETGKVIF